MACPLGSCAQPRTLAGTIVDKTISHPAYPQQSQPGFLTGQVGVPPPHTHQHSLNSHGQTMQPARLVPQVSAPPAVMAPAQQQGFIRSTKGTSLSGNEKATAGIKKIYERKKSPNKGKHTIKVVDQSLIKLV